MIDGIRNAIPEIVAGIAGAMGWNVEAWHFQQSQAAAQAAEDLRKEAEEILAGWKLTGKPQITKDLDALAAQFKKVVAVFGETEEVLAAHALAYQEILRQHLGPIVDYLKQFSFSKTSSKTGAEQFYESQQQFRDAIAAIFAGDLTGLGDLTSLADTYLDLAQGFTAGAGFTAIEDEIKNLLQAVVDLVPGLSLNATNPTGGLGDPFNIVSDELQATIETGNTLLLNELRLHTTLLTGVRDSTSFIASRINDPLAMYMVN
jgi:hypothetical protein